MSDQIVAEEHPVKAGKLDEYIKLIMKDTNFHLLPLPESIRERFNIPLEYKPMSIMESTTRALASRNDYTGYEVRDQTGADIQFPPIPESASPIVSIVKEPQDSEDQSNLPPSQNDAQCSDHEPDQPAPDLKKSDEA
jgi:hypothetical protein